MKTPGSEKTQRKWRDMSRSQRCVTVVVGAVQLSLAIVAWVDLWRRPAIGVKGAKWIWALIIAVNFVGPVSYFKFGRNRVIEVALD